MTAAAAIMEEIQAVRLQQRRLPCQMYTMGTVLRHGSAGAEARWLPGIAAGDCGYRRSASPSRLGLRHPRPAHHWPPRGDHTSSTARRYGPRAPSIRSAAVARAHDPTELANKRTEGLSECFWSTCGWRKHRISVNPIRTMMNHATTELFFDDLRVPAENLIGEEGQGSATSSAA